MSLWREFTKGFVRENPLFRLVLGTCPSLAITTAAINGVGMGLALTFVLVGSNVVISMIRRFVPKSIRIPMYIVVIATFVTITDLAMNAYTHELWKVLGIFVPLIVVNCIVLARAEAFAGKNTVFRSFLDGLGMGLGYTIAIFSLSIFREILGSATLFGHRVLPTSYETAIIMLLPPGAFILLGFMLGFINKLTKHEES
jgi:electron transport complex protein RnfE